MQIMKLLIFLAFAAFGHCALLGSKKCTYGPSYWCSHIHHAKECGAVLHCMTTVWKNQQAGVAGSTETCFDVIKIIDTVRHSKEQPDLLERMAVGCTGMPLEKRSVCQELMADDQNEVFLLLKSDLPSMQVASALGLCSGFVDTVLHPEQVLGDYCADCVNFFTDIRQIINDTEAKAESTVKDLICSKLGPLQDLCDQIVDQYLHIAFNIIYQQLNPKDICLLLNLCTNQSRAELRNSIQYFMAKHQRNSEGCDLCQNVIKDIQNALRDTALQNEILTAVEDKVCPLLPGDLSNQCKSYVSQYGPLVFELLVSELDPKSVCDTIGLCNATKAENKLTVVPLSSPIGTVQIITPEKKSRTSANPLCALCEFVMVKLENMIGTNATEVKITAALEEVCSLLPSTLKTECDDFVSEYGPLVIKLLLEKIAPEAMCTALGLCAGDKPNGVNTLPEKNGDICIICETVLSYIKSALNDPDNEKTIEELLDEVCGVVPTAYKGLCDQLIQAYTPAIINLLNKYDDPVKICSGLGLCGSAKAVTIDKSSQPASPLKFQPMLELQPAKAHKLGNDKCTYGPSYWCASVENAKQCSALEHCVKYYKLKLDA